MEVVGGGSAQLQVGYVKRLVYCSESWAYGVTTGNYKDLIYKCSNLMVYRLGNLAAFSVECSKIAETRTVSGIPGSVGTGTPATQSRLLPPDYLVNPIEGTFEEITDPELLKESMFIGDVHTWHDVFPTMFSENEAILGIMYNGDIFGSPVSQDANKSLNGDPQFIGTMENIILLNKELYCPQLTTEAYEKGSVEMNVNIIGIVVTGTYTKGSASSSGSGTATLGDGGKKDKL